MTSTKNDLFEILNFNNLIKLLIKNWYLFVLSVPIAVAGAFFYIKISPAVYEVSTSVIKNEGTNSIQQASEQLLDDNIRFISESGRGRRSNNLENEILVLKSTSYIEKAIQGLDLQVSYYQHDRFAKTELYKSAPFLVILKPEYPQPVGCEFMVTIINENEFEISVEEKEQVSIFNLSKQQQEKQLPNLIFTHKGKFNQFLRTDNMNFKLLLNSNYGLNDIKGKTYSFRINTQKGLVGMLQWDIQIFPMSDNILSFSMRTTVPQKAIDILSNLTNYYKNNVYEKKLNISDKTIDYIDNQLFSIQSSLKAAESQLQRFQSSNQLTDFSRQSSQIFNEITGLENQKAVIEMNLKYYNYIDEYFQEKKEIELIAPSAMGIDDAVLNNLVNELLSLKAEKYGLLENNQDKSPYLREISIRIENLQKMIVENISYYKRSNRNVLADLNARLVQLNTEAAKLPKTQRELLGYEQQYEINDQLYTYLLEKKAEAEIAKASVQSEVEVLEPANTSGVPVAPKKKVLLFIGFVLGVFIPFAFIQLKEIFRKTFASEEEVRKNIDLPVIGRVYRNSKIGNDGDSSIPSPQVVECFRKIRSKLDYFVPGTGPKVITISSTISQEGKSFISRNLALTLASMHSKTVLIGFDLRKPKLYDNLDLENKDGMSDFLAELAGIEDIIQKSSVPNLDVIYAGKKPPNPGILISSPLLETLFDHLRSEYDYIIVDTPPVGIVMDGLPLVNRADLFLYVVRLKRSLIKETSVVIDEMGEQKQKNVSIIVNDVPLDKKGRYGYGYYGDK